MPVLCKRGVSFKPDLIIFEYKLLMLYLNISVYKLKQQSHRLRLFHVICK